MLMDFFEYCSEHVYRGFFVDLFVRPSNAKAIGMYKKRGYSVYRRVHAYYQGTPPKPAEDGFDMRMPLPRDTKRQTIRSHGESVVVQPQATIFEPFVHKGI